MRRLVVVLVTLGVLLLALAQPAAAAPPTRESGEYSWADGGFRQCEPSGGGQICTETSLSVHEAPEGASACLSRYTYSISANGRYRHISDSFGCADIAPDAFTVASDMSVATLAATVIPMTSCSRRTCSEEGTVTVSARFIGRGEVYTYSGRGSFTENDCRYRYSYDGANREAQARIWIDGQRYVGRGSFGVENYRFSSTC